MEIYKNCFENYEVSNFGNVRRKLKNGSYKNINGSILTTGGGYKYFQVQREGKRINYLFHHLVAKLFIEDRPDNLVIDHIDRNPLNNCVDNLRYCSQKENTHNCHRYRNDIEETDLRLRRNILSVERDRKNGRFKGIKRKKGTGQLYQRESGNWRAIITINKIKYDKTFKTKEEAEDFLNNCDCEYEA